MSGTPLEPYMNPPLWSKVLTQVISLGAIEICCRRQLARWIAYQAATPGTTIIKETPKPAVQQSRAQKLRALSGCLVGLLIPLPGMISAFKKDWAMPRWMVDGMWCGFMFWCLSSTLKESLWTLFPRKRILTRVRGKGSRADKWDYDIQSTGEIGRWSWSDPSLNRTLGFICAASSMLCGYMGYLQVMSVLCGMHILTMMVGWSAPRIKLKTIIMLEAGVLLLFALVFGIIAIIGLFSNKTKDKPKPSPDGLMPGQPSPWVFGLMTTFQNSMMYGLAGVFMIINMRYEHSRVAAPPAPQAPGAGVLVNHRASVPFLPLHWVSMATYTACGVVVHGLNGYGKLKEPCVDILVICLSTIVGTIAACAVWTWTRGDFKAWWNYTEDYASDIDFDSVIELDEDGKVVDEKRPVTP